MGAHEAQKYATALPAPAAELRSASVVAVTTFDMFDRCGKQLIGELIHPMTVAVEVTVPSCGSHHCDSWLRFLVKRVKGKQSLHRRTQTYHRDDRQTPSSPKALTVELKSMS
jgi:hypothetical protein